MDNGGGERRAGKRAPLSRRTWAAWAGGALAVALAAGVLLGLFAPGTTWLHYAVVAVLVVVALLVFHRLGGFDQLEAARRRNRKP